MLTDVGQYTHYGQRVPVTTQVSPLDLPIEPIFKYSSFDEILSGSRNSVVEQEIALVARPIRNVLNGL